ncbi:hypothetical protein [Streptomyces sp. NPDC003374]
MLRHEFQPGRLVAGIVLTGAGVLYAGDAAGTWQVPWFAAIPLVVGGLCLAGAVGLLGRAVRRHRTARTAQTGPSSPAGAGEAG